MSTTNVARPPIGERRRPTFIKLSKERKAYTLIMLKAKEGDVDAQTLLMRQYALKVWTDREIRALNLTLSTDLKNEPKQNMLLNPALMLRKSFNTEAVESTFLWGIHLEGPFWLCRFSLVDGSIVDWVVKYTTNGSHEPICDVSPWTKEMQL